MELAAPARPRGGLNNGLHRRVTLISRGSDLPLILILFGVIGGAVVGFLGLFLGPTLLAVGYELIREWNAVEISDAGLSVAD